MSYHPNYLRTSGPSRDFSYLLIRPPITFAELGVPDGVEEPEKKPALHATIDLIKRLKLSQKLSAKVNDMKAERAAAKVSKASRSASRAGSVVSAHTLCSFIDEGDVTLLTEASLSAHYRGGGEVLYEG